MKFEMEVPEINLLCSLAQRAMMSYQEAHTLHTLIQKLDSQAQGHQAAAADAMNDVKGNDNG